MNIVWSDDCSTMVDNVGFVEIARTQIELTGEDRAKFLHNLCTNEIKKLQPGQGVEAMLLDARGHVLFLGIVFCRTGSLVIDTMHDQGERLLAHLNKYQIREQVEFHDRTADWAEIIVAGCRSVETLEKLGIAPPDAMLAHVDAQLSGIAVQVRRVPFTELTTFALVVARGELEQVEQKLLGAGVARCNPLALEALRVEAGWPEADTEVTDKTLPQELARDRAAISFVKGCYIGQETVARIDALGHVNRYLVRLRIAGNEPPPAKSPISNDGSDVGLITSAAYSPSQQAIVALGYVRRGLHTTGTQLTTVVGPADVR